jgi:hypothetical protein
MNQAKEAKTPEQFLVVVAEKSKDIEEAMKKMEKKDPSKKELANGVVGLTNNLVKAGETKDPQDIKSLHQSLGEVINGLQNTGKVNQEDLKGLYAVRAELGEKLEHSQKTHITPEPVENDTNKLAAQNKELDRLNDKIQVKA